MTRDDLFNGIYDVLQDLDDYELIEVWNEYCDYNNYDDERIYYHEEINDLAYGMSPLDILDTYGAVAGCEYFKFTIWGTEECCYDDIEWDDLIEYIIDHEKDYGVTDIADLLEEYANNEEEDE